MNTVVISGAPEHCSLREIQARIEEVLQNDRCIDGAQKCKTLEGKLIPGKFEVVLSSDEDIEKLINLVVFDFEYNNVVYTLKVTKPRQPSSGNNFQATKFSSSNEDSSSEHSNFVQRLKDSEVSTLNILKDDDDDDIDSSLNILKDDDDDDDDDDDNEFYNLILNLPRKPTNWFELLQSDSEIFELFCDSCVLILSDDCKDEKQLLSSLKQNKFHDWKQIHKVVRLRDGILLVYKDEKVAENVVEAEQLVKTGLELNLKPVPPVISDQILIKGEFDSFDDVSMIVQCCTDVPSKLKKLHNSGMYLVVFEKVIDFDSLKKALKKLPLTKLKPQLLKICRSDCIKVQNIKETVSDDLIRISFMNKKYSSGTVTMVDRSENNHKTAFVYFADYKDSEKVIEMSKKTHLTVSSDPVDVSFFYPGTNESVDFLTNNIYKFQQDLQADKDVIQFALKSPDQQSNLYKELGDIANIEITVDPVTEKCLAKIEPINQENPSFNPEKVETECQNRIGRFLKKFHCEKHMYNHEEQDRIRSKRSWKEKENFIVIAIQNTTVSVLVRWSTDAHDKTKITGVRKHVELFSSWFEKACNNREECVQFRDDDFEVLTHCGIYETVLNAFGNFVSINLQKENKLVTFSGPKESVAMAIGAIKAGIKRTGSSDMSFLKNIQRKFLEKLLKFNAFTRSSIVKDIQEMLRNKFVKVLPCLIQKDVLCLKYDVKNSNELERAREVIKSMIQFQTFTVDHYYDKIIQEMDWKEIKSDITLCESLCIFEDEANTSITLVGYSQGFSRTAERISKFLRNNSETEKIVSLSYAKAMFFSLFSDESGADKILKDLEWCLKPKGIQLKGRSCIIQEATQKIIAVSHTIITDHLPLNIPGTSSYLKSENGEQFLKTVSTSTACVVLLDAEEPLEWRRAKTTGEQNSSLHVSVVSGDILTSGCEAMINPVGSNFNLTASKLSSTLLGKAGKEIAKQINHNPLIDAESLRVTQGGTSSFRNIAHVVTPKDFQELTKVLLETLKIVENYLPLKSLAIPAIGTGQSGMDPAIVAKAIHQAINQFKQTSPKTLKKIEIVIYENKNVQLFSKEFSSNLNTSQQAGSSRNSSSQKSRPQSKNNAPDVRIQGGDILQSNCDVLVNTVDDSFDLSRGLLTSKILQKAGQSIQTECYQCSQNDIFRITSGGKSQFQNIAHLVTPGNSTTLSTNLFQLLNVLDRKFQTTSIAIPAIGTGRGRLKPDDVAKAFGLAINNFLATNPKNLRSIEVVIFQKDMIPIFKNKINTSSGSSNSKNSNYNGDGKKSKFFDLKSEKKVDQEFVLQLTSNKRENIEKAFDRILQKLEGKCEKKVICDEALELLEDDDVDELRSLAKKHDVYLNSSHHPSKKHQLEIFGRKKNVSEAYTASLEMLKCYSKAATCAEYVIWKYQDPKSKIWINHSLKANFDLESSYKKKKKGNCETKMTINGKKRTLSVDFSTMEQKCSGYFSVCSVQRSDLLGKPDIPDFWDGKNSRQLVAINNNQHKTEYQEVLKKFNTTLSKKIVRIERVENKRLFKQFSAQKSEVDERVKSGKTKGPTTRELFHGTSSDTCIKIFKDGFNRSFAGKHGCWHGKGVYFATTSQYSHKFTEKNQKGEYKMFLVEVVTGEYTQGQKDMIDVPPKGGKSSDMYDCLVNDVKNPTEFVVFKDASAYPLYLITYS